VDTTGFGAFGFLVAALKPARSIAAHLEWLVDQTFPGELEFRFGLSL
jgi:hypothetical protein